MNTSKVIFGLLLFSFYSFGQDDMFYLAGQSGFTYDLTDGLISLWELDETSGTNAADAHGSNDGTYTNSPTLAQSTVANLGYSCQLDGTNDYVQVTSNVTGYASAITISSWVKPTDNANKHIFFLVKRTSSDVECFQFYKYKSTSAITFHQSAANYANSTSTLAITNNVWYHIAVTYDGSYVRFYVNGSQHGNAVAKTWTFSESDYDTFIGTDNAGNYTAGYFDQTAIWGRALSADEMTFLNDSQSGRPYVNFTACTHMLWDDLLDRKFGFKSLLKIAS